MKRDEMLYKVGFSEGANSILKILLTRMPDVFEVEKCSAYSWETKKEDLEHEIVKKIEGED